MPYVHPNLHARISRLEQAPPSHSHPQKCDLITRVWCAFAPAQSMETMLPKEETYSLVSPHVPFRLEQPAQYSENAIHAIEYITYQWIIIIFFLIPSMIQSRGSRHRLCENSHVRLYIIRFEPTQWRRISKHARSQTNEHMMPICALFLGPSGARFLLNTREGVDFGKPVCLLSPISMQMGFEMSHFWWPRYYSLFDNNE